MSLLIDHAVYEAERITFETAIAVCRGLAATGQSDEYKIGCEECAAVLQAIADKSKARKS
jgi:hypothetical protein